MKSKKEFNLTISSVENRGNVIASSQKDLPASCCCCCCCADIDIDIS